MINTNYSLSWLQAQADLYITALSEFLSTHGLYQLVSPIDHIAIRTHDTEDYERALSAFMPNLTSAQFIQMDNRRVATGSLDTSINMHEFGHTNLIEIKEPKPNKPDYAGLDHSEIFQENVEEIKAVLTNKKIPFELQDIQAHHAIVVKLNSQGQEIKFTTTPLKEVLQREREAGTLIKLK